MNKKIVLIAAGAVVALCVCAFIAIIGFGVLGGIALTQPTADVGEKFMQALKTADYKTAYGLCHPALQQKLGNVQGLQRVIENGKARPTSWSFNSRSVSNDQGLLEGTVTMVGGEGTVSLEFTKSGNEWKVSAFDLEAD
jgi:hypothetical protein